MADQTHKAINIAMFTAEACKQVIDGLDRLAALEQLRAKSFINLPDFDAAFAAEPSISHITGNNLINVLANSTPTIRAFMVDNNHEDNFQLTRPA